MTEPLDPSLRALGPLVARVAQTLQAGDDPDARAQAAADVEALRDLALAADRRRTPGQPAIFDVARVTDALGVFAEWLRSPTGANEVRARQAMTELEVTMGPLVGVSSASGAPRDDEAERDQHRRAARSALDDHFRAHPVKPLGAIVPGVPGKPDES